MNVPSCHLALTNPIQLHTLRCSGGPYAPKSSHRHAKTCLEPPDIWIDMCFTYIDELILAQIEDSCSWEHQTNLAQKSKQPPTDRSSSCWSGNDRRHFISMATSMPAYACSNLVIGSKTSRALSPFLTSCKPFFAHARSQHGVR